MAVVAEAFNGSLSPRIWRPAEGGEHSQYSGWRASIAEINGEQPMLFIAGSRVGSARSVSCGKGWSGPLLQTGGVYDPGTGWFHDSMVFVVAEATGRLHSLYEGIPTADFVSDDLGLTWNLIGRVYLQNDATGSGAWVAALGFSRTEPGVGIGSIVSRSGRGRGGMARTDDGGRTWQAIPITPPGSLLGEARQRFLVDPDASVTYGFIGPSLRRLTYSGGSASVETLAQFESEITATAMSPDGGRFYVATAHHGLHLSRDRGVTWAPVDGPAEVQFWRGLEVSALEEGLLYGFGADGGFWIHREPIDGS